MGWCTSFFTAVAGWDGVLLMCGALVIFWALAIAGMVALFHASTTDSDTSPPAPPIPAVSADVEPASDRFEHSARRTAAPRPAS